ncbi:hypothetical protein ASPCAL06262 [Aspergillus calidoustus]|uniref:Integral membrane protein n=1 Tax=Aspergillus calidoustus TaxID=454130 RepID=A0A0U5G0J1_ASPCI|nr:hypothetical protein ASPCAL06262 [Aspergillus calidoustus]
MTPTLAPTPAILGTSMLGLGIYRILSPRQAYTLFGLPFPQPPRDTPSPFIYNCAGRDLTLGAAYLLLGAQKNREGLRALVLATAIAAHADALTVWVHGGGEYGGWRGKWVGHALGGVLLVAVACKGWGL